MSQDMIESPEDGAAHLRLDYPLGIYFGMQESEYFADVALGSSDMKTLRHSAMRYWFESRWNPLREPEENTPAKIYGSAVHKLALEGRAEFDKLYGAKHHSWSTKEGKIEKERFAMSGKKPLPIDAYARCLQTGAILRANPYLANAFDGSCGHEVSVFWEREGIKRRARFDVLKERAIVDLKNVANERGISFPRACMRKIDDFSYDMQAEHYREGRLAMRALWEAGKVFGNYDADALERVVASEEFSFVFIFLQSSGAPEVWSTKLSYKADKNHVDEQGALIKIPGYRNEIFDIGRVKIIVAEKHFLTYREKFGMETPWVSHEPIAEFDLAAMPPWFSRDVDTEST